ncbi:MAG: isoprenyl transferase [Lachnospiraceae bacterium]|jgi:undecaprenyl diphosphate synthase
MDIRNEKLGLVIPCHVAIIMDGNGRWAKQRHMPRTYGHAAGAKNVKSVVRIADDIGIQYLTIYAFSTENWKRSAEEVSALMTLLKKYLRDYIGECNENNVRCRIIGRRDGLRQDLVDEIIGLEEATKANTGLQFTIAINYGGRDEITRAVQEIAREAKDGRLDPEAISEDTISAHLDTRDLPDPDLLIRTSGEERLSNYLPWQLAYTEFYFTDVYWPDFGRDDLIEAVRKYNQRERRFGGVIS